VTVDPNIIAAGQHEPLRIGAIGAGLAMERLHWPALSRLRNHVNPTAFAEPNDEAAARFQGETGLPASARYTDYHQVGFLAFARSDGDLLDAGTHPVKYGTQA
jgi:predicted dehydrogenase